MVLAVAKIGESVELDLIQYSAEFTTSGAVVQAIGDTDKLVEIHQLLISSDSPTGTFTFEEVGGLAYVGLSAPAQSLLYSDFQDKPLTFTVSGSNSKVDVGAVSMHIMISIWYRLIDA